MSDRTTTVPVSKNSERAGWKLVEHTVKGKGVVFSGNCPRCGKPIVEYSSYSLWVHGMGGCHPDYIVSYTSEGKPIYSHYD
jgi:hypothetical protein